MPRCQGQGRAGHRDWSRAKSITPSACSGRMAKLRLIGWGRAALRRSSGNTPRAGRNLLVQHEGKNAVSLELAGIRLDGGRRIAALPHPAAPTGLRTAYDVRAPRSRARSRSLTKDPLSNSSTSHFGQKKDGEEREQHRPGSALVTLSLNHRLRADGRAGWCPEVSWLG